MQKRRFRVVLTECETVYTLELHGKFELENVEGYDLIGKSNERYKHVRGNVQALSPWFRELMKAVRKFHY